MRNAVIVGATSGIGKATARLLESEGWKIYSISRSVENHLGIAWDVSAELPDLSQIPSEVHALVYCPGTINLKPFKRLTTNDFLTDFEINVLGAVRIIQGLESRLKAGNGSVVLFSTVAVGQGMSFHASVAAAKGAVEGLCRSLAAEYAPSVRFNCIAPSLTDTPLADKLLNSEAKRDASAQRHPLKAICKAEDVAAMVRLLVSDGGRFITGQTFGVDGGLSTVRL
jgi:NAD(P)-dependent dehydrogenase (short-subunit alcohol dehydrogenase family)